MTAGACSTPRRPARPGASDAADRARSPPGGYYLVQEAAGTGGTDRLPTPDATGTIAMSGDRRQGRARHRQRRAALRRGLRRGAARCATSSATAPRPTTSRPPRRRRLSNTTAAMRAAGGADTDNNSADFTVGAPNPRNSGGSGPPPDTAPTVTATDPANDTNDVPVDGNVARHVQRAGRACRRARSRSPARPAAQHAFTLSGGAAEYTLDPTADFVREDRCRLIVRGAEVHDSDTADPPDTMAGDSHDVLQHGRRRGPADPRHPGRPAPLALREPGRHRRARRGHRRRARTASGSRTRSPTATRARPRASSCSRPAPGPPVGTAVVFSGRVQEFKARAGARRACRSPRSAGRP